MRLRPPRLAAASKPHVPLGGVEIEPPRPLLPRSGMMYDGIHGSVELETCRLYYSLNTFYINYDQKLIIPCLRRSQRFIGQASYWD